MKDTSIIRLEKKVEELEEELAKLKEHFVLLTKAFAYSRLVDGDELMVKAVGVAMDECNKEESVQE